MPNKDFCVFLKARFDHAHAFHNHLYRVRTYGDTPDFWDSFDTMTDAMIAAERQTLGAWIASEGQDWKVVGETSPKPDEKRFTFSADLIATVTVTAKDETLARTLIEAAFRDAPDSLLGYGVCLTTQLTDDEPLTLESAE